MDKAYNFKINLNWDLVSLMSQLDRFDASWSALERKEGPRLRQLKTIATIRSVGASTRIEGSRLNDEEVDALLQALETHGLADRDQQEVAGYFEVMELIGSSYRDIAVTENAIKELHQRLLKYCSKDVWHRGGYKQHSNRVQAEFADGRKQVIFETTPPGYPTEDAMQSLIAWYQQDTSTHPLVKIAVFTYEFLSIHPFQDGNGRLSRLLSMVLMLKQGYSWIEYISFEHEIENRKMEYYNTLRRTQAQRPDEDITQWVVFFFAALLHIQQMLLLKLQQDGVESGLTPKERTELLMVREYSGIKSGALAAKLSIPNPTIKRLLSTLVKQNLIEKEGVGRGTSYRVMA